MAVERVCPWWMAYTFDHPGRYLYQRPKKVLGGYLAAGMTVMDIGCGMGFFSIAMAKMIGEDGAVIAVDLQQKMLDVLMKRAKRKGVAGRIRPHRCEQHSLGILEPVDFVIACYVVHEVPDPERLFTEIRACLKPNAKLLVLEPGWHVAAGAFEKSVAVAQSVGLRVADWPQCRIDRAVLLDRAPEQDDAPGPAC